MGCWADGKKKPYVDGKGNSGEADRIVAKQPLVFTDTSDDYGADSKPIFNLRKMNELPYHLALAKRVDDLKEHVVCDFQFLYQKIRCLGIERSVQKKVLLFTYLKKK